MLIDNLPGYCDNINRASDGKYWLAFVGLRTPVYDLAMRNPGLSHPHGQADPAGRVAVPGASITAA